MARPSNLTPPVLPGKATLTIMQPRSAPTQPDLSALSEEPGTCCDR